MIKMIGVVQLTYSKSGWFCPVEFNVGVGFTCCLGLPVWIPIV
jgi:hypothetical protein